MPTGILLFVWRPEERARWVETPGKRDRAIRHVRATSADLDKAQAEGVELSHRGDYRGCRQQNSSSIPLGTYWAQNLLN